jgi:hypothetical protein
MFTQAEADHIICALIATRSLATSDEARERTKNIAVKVEALFPGTIARCFAQSLLK